MKKKIISIFLCLVICLSLFPVGAFAADDCEAYHEELPTIEWANANIASHGSCSEAQASQTGSIPDMYILGGSGDADGYSEVSGNTGYNLYWHLQDFRILCSDGFYYYPSDTSIDYWCAYKSADRTTAKILDDFSVTLIFDEGYTKNLMQGCDMEISQEMWDLNKNIQMQYSKLYPNGVTLTKNDVGENAKTGTLSIQGNTGQTEAFCHFLYSAKADNIHDYLEPYGDYNSRADSDGTITLSNEQEYQAVRAKSAAFSFTVNGKEYHTDIMESNFGLTYHDRCYGVALGGGFTPVKPKVNTVIVKKSVNCADSAVLPTDAGNTEFSFSMTIKDTEGKMHTCEIPYKKGAETGTLITTDGKYRFTLKSGETLSFETPVSTTTVIQITETNIPKDYVCNYQVDGGEWQEEAVTSEISVNKDTVISFNNLYAPPIYTLTYNVAGDSVYGIPTDSVTPPQVTNIAWNGKVDPLAAVPTTSWKTSDGTDNGIPGNWTFSPTWSSDTTYADELTKVEGIKKDVDVYGKWTFTPDTYKVTYIVKEDEKWGAPEDSITPTDTTAYDYKDDVIVAPALTTTQGYAKDEITGRNVPGTWTFTPWDKDDFQITENTTITGRWTFTPDTPPTPPVDPEIGNLTVSKIVSGNAADGTKAFSFTVTLVNEAVSGTYGDMTFVNGIAAFTLKGGESKTAIGLPAGMGYTVAEADYSADGYVTTKNGDMGTIANGRTVRAVFTNTKNTVTPPMPPVDLKVGNLTVSKHVSGDLGDKTKYFTFKIEFNVDGTFSYTGSKIGTISSGDTIQLRHGESITIIDIPAGTSYTVTESGSSGYTVYASGDTGIIADGKTSTAKFTNTRSSVPKTGDDSNMPLWLGLIGISGVGMICSLLAGKKNGRKPNHLKNK